MVILLIELTRKSSGTAELLREPMRGRSMLGRTFALLVLVRDCMGKRSRLLSLNPRKYYSLITIRSSRFLTIKVLIILSQLSQLFLLKVRQGYIFWGIERTSWEMEFFLMARRRFLGSKKATVSLKS